MVEHGGALRRAAERFGIPLEEWLDLSTGINPCGWPVPEVPRATWRRLPESSDGLELAAAEYYGNHSLLPVAGSQAAIQALPRLRPPGRVAIVAPTYFEHRAAWAAAGHIVIERDAASIDEDVDDVDVLVLVNPNNPTGDTWQPDQLASMASRLARRGGWLIVDEAFVDATPSLSVAPEAGSAGLVVLRSLGKFFGLGGARVGFALGERRLLERLDSRLGPWALSGPGRHVARLALTDRSWQRQTAAALSVASARLETLMRNCGLSPSGGTALFQWCVCPGAARIQHALARRGILVRQFDSPPSLRFGLPGPAEEWNRLESELKEVGAELERSAP